MTKITTARESSRPNAGPKCLDASLDSRSKRALIQWPADEELDQVAAQLRRITQIGISSEDSGDYFTSGDIAYQLREIVRTASELLKKSLRNEPP